MLFGHKEKLENLRCIFNLREKQILEMKKDIRQLQITTSATQQALIWTKTHNKTLKAEIASLEAELLAQSPR